MTRTRPTLASHNLDLPSICDICNTSSTPSDWRAVRNAVSMLARADGYRVMEVDRG